MQRIEAVAELLGMTLGEVIKSAESREAPIDMLSELQEKALVEDLRLLLVGTCVTNRWSFQKILAHYQFTEPELIRLMVQLDRLGIIELLPGNRYRLFVSRNFRWRNNGPLQAFFFQTVLQDFFSPDQSEDKSYYRFIWGLTAQSEMAEIRNRIDRLASEFVSITEETPYTPEKHGSILLVSFRHDWQPPQFRAVKRTE